MIKDPYFNTDRCVKRLYDWYKEHDSLIIAFDFDDTIFDLKKKGFKYSEVIKLLRVCKRLKFTLILFTSRETQEQLDEAYEECKALGFQPSFVNYSPVMPKAVKPYYNILLDDKAGLGQAFNILSQVISIIIKEKK